MSLSRLTIISTIMIIMGKAKTMAVYFRVSRPPKEMKRQELRTMKIPQKARIPKEGVLSLLPIQKPPVYRWRS